MTLPDSVLFIGLGGAGQRHLRILKGLLPATTRYLAYRRTRQTPLLRPDFSVDPAGSVEQAYGLTTFDSLDAAFAARPGLVVISTPSSLHLEPMLKAVEIGADILVEKPWSADLEGFSAFRDAVRAKNLKFQVSFQRRFHPLLAQVKTELESGTIGRPMTASFTVYSHVPSWHAYEDYRTLYAVRGDLGGGVLLTEIHELDLCLWYFGLPLAVFCAGGSQTKPALEVEDTVHLTLLYPGWSVQLVLCFMHQRAWREFHVAGTAGHLAWHSDGNRLSVEHFGSAPQTLADPAYPNDAMFQAQAQRFLFDWTEADTQAALDSAGGSLAIVAAAKRSMRSGHAEPVTL